MSESKAFKRAKFEWLDRVKAAVQSHRLPPSAFLVAYELMPRFNEDKGGAAWPSCKTVGDGIGLGETTVLRILRRMEALDLLTVEWGHQGRGHPGRYWMTTKLAPVVVSDDAKLAPVAVSGDDLKPPSEAGENLHPGTQNHYLSPQNLHQCKRPLSTTYSKREIKEDSPPHLNSDQEADQQAAERKADADFARFWSVFPNPVAMPAARLAFSNALLKANAETLIAGAGRYAKAQALPYAPFPVQPAKWLDTGRWLDGPPKPNWAAEKERKEAERKESGII